MKLYGQNIVEEIDYDKNVDIVINRKIQNFVWELVEEIEKEEEPRSKNILYKEIKFTFDDALKRAFNL